MEILDQLRKKSSRFVWSDKIRVAQLPGRGNSVICSEALSRGELMIHVPADLLITVRTAKHKIDPSFEWSTHEILALELLRMKNEEENNSWIESLPRSFDNMPLKWSKFEQQLVPHQDKLAKQRMQLEEFANKVDFSFEDSSWAWLCVNTRCFYWHDGGMAMAPVIDYLNHSCNQSRSLKVESNFQGITVTTTREYEVGEELTFCYGPYDNGFLLVEYGFLASEPNPWDVFDVTKDVCELLDPAKRLWLQENGYWLDYTVDRDGQPSFRTEVALAALQSANDNHLNNLISGYDDGALYRSKSDEYLQMIAKNTAEKIQMITPNIRTELQQLLMNYSIILSKIIK